MAKLNRIGYVLARGKLWLRYAFLPCPPRDCLVSVILANHNGEATLEAAVRSLLNQSHRALEILIIDDASTDGSVALMRRLAAEDARIRLFLSPVNRGVYWSFNYLLDKTRGAYITFQAADDRSTRHRIRTQLALLMPAEKVASVIAYRRIDARGKALRINGRTRRFAYALMLFKKSAVLPVLGHFDTVRFGADTEWWERMQLSFPATAIAKLDLVFYEALFHPNSLTRIGPGAHGWRQVGKRHYRSQGNPVRGSYHAASRHWHHAQVAQGASLYLAFPLVLRPFETPPENSIAAAHDPLVMECIP